jgi:nucleolar protein 9
MPNENKKRGKRKELKRKRELEHLEHGRSSKRQRWQEQEEVFAVVPDVPAIATDEGYGETEAQRAEAVTFYGLLDDEEQAYFRRADTMLQLNQFADEQERSLFVASLYREANGKELKIANSQSCSRMLERLIQMSSGSQLKNLFHKFSGQRVPHLSGHWPLFADCG